MNGVNVCLIAGNLGIDPVVELIGETKKARLFVLANDRVPKKQADGSTVWEEVSRPVNVECWGSQADYCEKYLKKGSPVIVEGRFEFNGYEDKETGKKMSRPYIHAYKIVGAGSKAELSEAEKLEIALKWINWGEGKGDTLQSLKAKLAGMFAERVQCEALAKAGVSPAPQPEPVLAGSAQAPATTDDDLPF